jgi:hypothetical protein
MRHTALVVTEKTFYYPTTEERNFLYDFTEDSDHFVVVTQEDLDQLDEVDKKEHVDLIYAISQQVKEAEKINGPGAAITIAVD